MRGYYLVFLVLSFSAYSFALNLPDSLSIGENWVLQGRAYVHMSQGAQFQWAKGGDNIFSSLIKTKVKARYKKGKRVWENELKWNYGFLFVGVPNDIRKNVEYRTSDDNIELNSSVGYKATGDFYYSGLFNFKTQFFPSYKYPNDSVKVSNFLSPAYIVFSAGIVYSPNANLKLMLSPLTSKTTLVVKESQVDETKYGLKKGARLYREIGAYLKFYNKVKLYDNIFMENNLTLFSNYEYKPQNVDVELQTDISFRINKYFKALMSFHFIYDDDEGIPINEFIDGVYKETGYTKGLQFQEKIMIGLGVEF